jgi:hypothetical protein
VAAQGRRIETDAAPIRYVASIFGVTDPEVAIRWLIALMALCCDPLAIALTAALRQGDQPAPETTCPVDSCRTNPIEALSGYGQE